MKLQNYLRFLPLVVVPTVITAADIVVTADITTPTTWTADNTYILRKSIFVKSNTTLTIEPGTLILGDNAAGVDGILDTTDDTYGSLVITRGAKLMAEGTECKPIVFTAIEERDGIAGDPNDKPDPAAGDGGFWGGVVILGKAPINFFVAGVNANENLIEGFPGSSDDIKYGGNIPADNSGILKYASIRFGGYIFDVAKGREINGLTMGGVGNGTTIENVEIISNTDDGMEIFGGTVNTKRIAVAFCQDDSFDLDEGHQGFHQFWFGLQNAEASLGDRGGEWDGGNGSTTEGEPFTNTRIFNMTMIGNGTDTAPTANAAFFLDDNFAGQLHNSVIHDFSGVAIANSGDGVGDGTPVPVAVFSNNTWGSFVGGAGQLATLGAAGSPTGTGNSAISTNPLLRGISRDANGLLNPLPQTTSPALVANGATLSGFPVDAPVGFFETTDYRGAFDSDNSGNWLKGWSYLSQKGYLAEVEVTADITTPTTWTADKTYVLRKSIFVKNNTTLTIEPGTVVLGDNAAGVDGILDTTDDTYGSLVITRGAKLMAEGTPSLPIDFTAFEELHGIDGDLFDKLDPAAGDGGFWGGIVLLGKAPINFFVAGVNANENLIEGFPGSSDDIKYGGNIPADNSGSLKYASIRFGGYIFDVAKGREINGLTMGGVGNGTTIENVEIISNTDDGMEIFGGTVNTKRIAVAFCQDDSFDLDEGHQGFHQFWFGLQNAEASLGDRGGEWDGGNGSTTEGVPFTNTRIYNMTMIGNGTDTAPTANAAFFLDDNFAGQLHNSVIHDFSGAAIANSGDGVGDGTPVPVAVFSNNTWGSFVGGAGQLATLGAAGSPTGTGNSAISTNPLLVGISRIPNAGLDPRPNLLSPVYTSARSAFPVDAPVGFFETVNHRGAFGGTNWLNGWSWLSRCGYFTGLPDVGSEGEAGAAPFADVDGDGISDTLEATTALTDLGFSVGVNNVSPTNLFDSIYTTSSILDLVAPNQVIVQKSGGNVTLSLALFRSTNLQSFTPAPFLDATFPATEPAEFYRIEVPAAE